MKKGSTAIGIIIGIIIISIAFFLSSGKSQEKNLDDNLEKAKKEFQSGNYSIIVDIPKDYYIRPEFYPNYNSDERYGARKAIYGYGAYPADVTYIADNISVNASQGIEIYTLLFVSTGVYAYQGLGFIISSPNDELFETHIVPTNILLSPKYLGNSSNVSDDWVYKLKITVIAKKDIPIGEYIFKLQAGNPSPEKEAEYKKVNGTYISGSPIQPSKLFEFILKVQ